MLKLISAASLCSVLFLTSCGSDDNGGTGGSSVGGFKKITFGTNISGSGDHGVADADLKCGAGYKALIGSSIERSPNLNWVLKANTEYRRADGVTIIGKTNSNAVFTFPLTNSFGATAGSYFTGIQADWTIDTTKNCSDWGSMADDRTYGNALSVTSTAIAENISDCGTTGPVTAIVCVEQ